jgi:hypothetical protein
MDYNFYRKLENKYRLLYKHHPDSPLLSQDTILLSNSNYAICNYDNFKHNFDIFTENSLNKINWDNVLVIGESVLMSIIPNIQNIPINNISLLKNITIALYDVKIDYDINNLINNLMDNIIINNNINIKIIPTPYKSISHILFDIDIDCEAVGYNGKDLFFLPTTSYAIKKKKNVIDSERPINKDKLIKYGSMGFNIVMPNNFEFDANIFFVKDRSNLSELSKLLASYYLEDDFLEEDGYLIDYTERIDIAYNKKNIFEFSHCNNLLTNSSKNNLLIQDNLNTFVNTIFNNNINTLFLNKLFLYMVISNYLDIFKLLFEKLNKSVKFDGVNNILNMCSFLNRLDFAKIVLDSDLIIDINSVVINSIKHGNLDFIKLCINSSSNYNNTNANAHKMVIFAIDTYLEYNNKNKNKYKDIITYFFNNINTHNFNYTKYLNINNNSYQDYWLIKQIVSYDKITNYDEYLTTVVNKTEKIEHLIKIYINNEKLTQIYKDKLYIFKRIIYLLENNGAKFNDQYILKIKEKPPKKENNICKSINLSPQYNKLLEAVWNNNYKPINDLIYLIDLPFIIANDTINLNTSPIHLSIERKNITMFTTLCNAFLSEDLVILLSLTCDNLTILGYIIKYDFLEAISVIFNCNKLSKEFLIKITNSVDIIDINNIKNKRSIFEHLLYRNKYNEANILVPYLYNYSDKTIISACVDGQCVKTFIYLFNYSNINLKPNYCDENGDTILHKLSDINIKKFHDYINCVKLIIKLSPESINKKNIDGITPLMVAIKSNNIYVLELLLKYGANTYEHDKYGWYCIHYVSKYSTVQEANIFLRHSQRSNLLVSDQISNFSLDIVTLNEQYTPLIVSIISENYELFEYLLTIDNNISKKDIYNNTIYHYMGIKQYYTNVMNKMNKIQDININKNIFGITPVDYLFESIMNYKIYTSKKTVDKLILVLNNINISNDINDINNINNINGICYMCSVLNYKKKYK